MDDLNQAQNINFHNYQPRFDIEGQALCLDFANTLDWHASSRPVEHLKSYIDLVAWGFEAGLLNAEEANHLARRGFEQAEEAQSVLAEAIELRESIYSVFVAVAQEKDPPAQCLGVLTRYWQQAVLRLRLVQQGEQVGWDWVFSPEDLRRVLWPVSRSAIDLLQGEQCGRVGQCEDERGCGYLFLDTSRNRSRRWCSMESCGNRAKATRHYARGKK